jgi:hypothetical protein
MKMSKLTKLFVLFVIGVVLPIFILGVAIITAVASGIGSGLLVFGAGLVLMGVVIVFLIKLGVASLPELFEFMFSTLFKVMGFGNGRDNNESDVTPRDNTLGRAFPDNEHVDDPEGDIVPERMTSPPPTIDEWLDRDLDDLDPADSDRTPRRPRDFRPGDGRPTPS